MKKKKKFDAVGWKLYCSRLSGGARRWLGALGAQQAQAWAGMGASRALDAGARGWREDGSGRAAGAGRAWARGRRGAAVGGARGRLG